MAKVSYPTQDIQRSCACNTWCKRRYTYFSLILLTTFENTSFKSYHWKGNWTCPQWCRTKCFNHGFSIEDKIWYPFPIYNINPFKVLLGRIKFVIRALSAKVFCDLKWLHYFLLFCKMFFYYKLLSSFA